MFKSLNKNIVKIIICLSLFFSGVNIVYAFNVFSNVTNGIYSNCSEATSCVPLCSYGNDDAMIGYFYDNYDIMPKSGIGWEITFHSATSSNYNDNIFYYVLDESGRIPNSHIYDGIKDWQQGDLYNDLDNSFKCPNIFYRDSSKFGGYNEMCFSNSTGKCENISDLTSKFKSGSKLSYSFSEDYKKIMSQLYSNLSLTPSRADEEDNKNLEFLSLMDPGFKYDSSISYKENSLKNCDYLKSKLDGEELSQQYSKQLNSSDYISKYYTDVIDVSLQDLAFGYKYSYAYKFNNLKNIMSYNNKLTGDIVFRNIVFDADKTFKDVGQIPVVNASRIALKVASVCNEDHMTNHPEDGNNEYINYNANNFTNTVKEDYEIYLFKDPKIEFIDEYDCSFLTDVADLISHGYFILEMAGLVILIVFSVMDYVKIFLNDNSDELKKANTNLFKRLIIAVLLFLLPALVNFVLRIFKIEGVNSDHPLCVQISNK